MLSFALSRSNAEAMPEAPKKEENFQESPVHAAPSPQAAPALELPHLRPEPVEATSSGSMEVSAAETDRLS